MKWTRLEFCLVFLLLLLTACLRTPVPRVDEAGFEPVSILSTTGVTVVNLDTLGGAYSYAVFVNEAGQIAGQWRDTSGSRRAFIWDAANGMQDLGTLGGNGTIRDLNESGQVVGDSFDAEVPNDYERAFVADAVNGMQDLGTLGGNSSRAFAINDAGQVVGYSSDTAGQARAFIWDATNGMQDLGTLGGNSSHAFAINDAGQVAGHSVTASGQPRAFIWDAVNGMQDLGTLGGNSYAEAINDAGQVAGYAFDTAGQARAFIWDATNGMQDLGTLGGHIGVNGLNEAGQVVGAALTPLGWRAFIADAASGMQDLGALDGGNSYAEAINDAGQVVGSSSSSKGSSRAFVWDATNGMQDLGTLSGSRAFAFAINDAGQVAGSSDDASGRERAVRWTLASTGSGSTPTGSDVTVHPPDLTSGEPAPVGLTFDSVEGEGTTTITSQEGGPRPPSGFKIGNNTYFEIDTTATFTGEVTLAFDYSDLNVNENRLAVYHLVTDGSTLQDGSTCTKPNGCWEDITLDQIPEGFPGAGGANPDTQNQVIYGRTSSFSLFALAETLTVDGPAEPVQIGTPINVSSDLGDTTAVESATWDWGDGTTDTVASPGSPLTGSHAYGEAGVYTITLTLEGAGGSTMGEAQFQYAVAYDPDGGFVTGGGWIDSPAGACEFDACTTDTVGKAHFGFVSRYQRGASTPSGNTEFQFKAGSLNFHSSTYEWLVIANHRAQYKGTGTINGEGDYGFLLTGLDADTSGSPVDLDAFRIKIWDRNDSDQVVYDNQMGEAEDSDAATSLGGGNIRIHRK